MLAIIEGGHLTTAGPTGILASDPPHVRLPPDVLEARVKALRFYLEQYRDLTESATPAGVRAATSSHVPLMPHQQWCQLMLPTSDTTVCTCWQRDLRELERLLRVMRDNPGNPILRDQDGRKLITAGRPVTLRRLHWQLHAYFIDARRTPEFHLVPLRKGKRPPRIKQQEILKDPETGRYAATTVGWRVTRHPDASEALAQAGVDWLAEHWALTHEPKLPRELLAA